MIDQDSARKLLDRINGTQVMVVGDVMLDVYLYGDSRRLSPEAPVPVVKVERQVDCLGGAANVARNLADLGARPVLIGVVGDDPEGDRLRAAMTAAGVDDAAMIVEPGRRTAVKTRVVCRGQQVVRVDQETTSSVSDQIVSQIRQSVADCGPDTRAIVFSDYAKGVLDPGHSRDLIAATPAGVYACVDPIPHHVPSYGSAGGTTPNEQEARDFLRLPPEQSIDDHELVRRFFDAAEFSEVFVTLGARGVVWMSDTAGAGTIPTVPRQVFDVSGAGDTMIAVVSVLRGLGVDIQTTLKFANLCAGLVVQKLGTATVYPAEVIESAQ